MRAFLAVFTVLALVLAGCAGYQAQPPQQQPAGVSQNNTPPVNVSPSVPTPEFSVASPAAGAQVTAGDLLVQIETKNFLFGEVGSANKDGEGHFQIYLDKEPFSVCASENCTIANMTPGQHTIKVEMHNNDNSPYPGVAAKIISISAYPQATFDIVSPTPNSGISYGTITVKLNATNFEISQPEAPNAPNQGNFQLSLDGGNYTVCYALQCQVSGVTTGPHTIRVEMHNNDHSIYAGGIVRTISFIAIGAAG
jgi:hypothetical protein